MQSTKLRRNGREQEKKRANAGQKRQKNTILPLSRYNTRLCFGEPLITHSVTDFNLKRIRMKSASKRSDDDSGKQFVPNS